MDTQSPFPPPPEPVPTSKPSAPRAPRLTTHTRAVDKQLGVSPPGAGGWTPSDGAVRAIGAIGITCGAMAPVLTTQLAAPLGVILGALCGAICGGCTYFAAKSAGPRRATE